MSKELQNCSTIISISLMIRFIMGMLASKLSASYIEIDIYKAGDIYHIWDISGQAILVLGIGIAFWKYYLAPLAITTSIAQFGKVLSIQLKDLPVYNFNETFFFINLLIWCIYTTFSWKFNNFKTWYYPCIFLQITLGYIYLLLKPYV